MLPDPQVEIVPMHTDGRDQDMRRVVITLYGTKAQADMVAHDIRLYLREADDA